MKKKLIVIIAAVLVVSLLVTLLVGCDEIFKKNETRDANQIVATVFYKGVSAHVYKFELQASFNSYAYLYVSYYGLTYQQAAEYLLKSLAQQKLLSLYAREVVLDYMKTNHADKIDANLTYATATSQDLLSTSEVDHAIKTVNDSLLSSLKNLIKEAISEDNYNTSETKTSEETVEVTDPVTVKFDSNSGSDVDNQKIQRGTKAKEPTKPTRSGYTFYGWYANADFSGEEFDFDTAIDASLTLYAKWVKYVAPRTVKEDDEDEDEDYDPDVYIPEDQIRAKFFSEEYQAGLYAEIDGDDCVKNMEVPSTSTYEETLKTYIGESLSTLKKNITNNIHKANENECYDYYLASQCDSLLIEKLQRVIGEGVTVTEEEVRHEFELALAKNQESFVASDSAYESALKSSLASTYYHTSTADSYGFVINILLKLDDESVAALNERYTNQKNEEMVRIERNRAVSEMKVYVSNPDYDPDAKIEDAEGNEIEVRDPMTDERNPYLAEGTEYNANNDYSQILSFEKNAEGKFEIVYNAKEHPAMPYLVNQVYAFDHDTTVGIIHQINNSFAQVKAFVEAGELTHIEGVYWLREVATAWLYLVGDDSGALSSDSNNGGLGYLITPAGKTSNYLEAFTDYARNLIAVGTGAYQIGDLTADDFKGADAQGEIAGDGKAFVVADNVGSSSAYAGVFVLLASDKVWDGGAYTYEDANGAELDAQTTVTLDDATGVLPLNYVVTYAKSVEDSKTIYDTIYDTLFEGKKSNEYSARYAALVKDNEPEYFEKVYKSLYKDLD